jgi:hypothetical protein
LIFLETSFILFTISTGKFDTLKSINLTFCSIFSTILLSVSCFCFFSHRLNLQYFHISQDLLNLFHQFSNYYKLFVRLLLQFLFSFRFNHTHTDPILSL